MSAANDLTDLMVGAPQSNVVDLTRRTNAVGAHVSGAPPTPVVNATKLEWALWLASRGLPVHPNHYPTRTADTKDAAVCSCSAGIACGSVGKHPILTGWQRKATASAVEVRTMWLAHPNANPGVHTGRGSFFVLDEDGDEGRASAAALEAKHGPLPMTFTVQTGMGVQRYFGMPAGIPEIKNTVGIAPKVDIRANGGNGANAVGPGALHWSGRRYAVLDAAPIAPAPPWLLAFVSEKPQAKTKTQTKTKTRTSRGYGGAALADACATIAAAVEGTRNATLNTEAFSIAQLVAGGELDEDEARAALEDTARQAGLKDDEIAKTLQSAFDAGAKTPRTRPVCDDPALEEKLIIVGEKHRVLQPCAANVATVLQHHPDWHGVVALNIFHLRFETTRPPPWHSLDAPKDAKVGAWTDADTARLSNWFARTSICGLPPISVSAKTIEAAVLVAAEANTFHPVRDYLRGLPAWDDEKRIDTWVSRYLGGESTPYTCAAGAALLIGLVARVMRPGCKLDTMLVLEGKQGAQKSTALEALTSPWFADSRLPIGEKDAMQMLAGVWLWEIGELAGLSKADVETVKAFLSSPSDRYRPSYGRHAVDVPRQTAFAGSTNATTYLQDETGGRRFYPVKTGTIDVPAITRDRDQLWAEAVLRFQAGDPWWLDDALAAPEQAARYAPDVWQAAVVAHLEGQTSTTIADILELVIFSETDTSKNTLAKWGQREQNRVARILTHLGWVRRQVRVPATGLADKPKREWRYVSPLFDPVTSLHDEVVT